MSASLVIRENPKRSLCDSMQAKRSGRKNHAQQSAPQARLTATLFVDNKRKTVANKQVSRNFYITAIVLTYGSVIKIT